MKDFTVLSILLLMIGCGSPDFKTERSLTHSSDSIEDAPITVDYDVASERYYNRCFDGHVKDQWENSSSTVTYPDLTVTTWLMASDTPVNTTSMELVGTEYVSWEVEFDPYRERFLCSFNSVNGRYQVESTSRISFGKWTQVVCGFGSEVSIYVDGVKQVSVVGSGELSSLQGLFAGDSPEFMRRSFEGKVEKLCISTQPISDKFVELDYTKLLTHLPLGQCIDEEHEGSCHSPHSSCRKESCKCRNDPWLPQACKRQCSPCPDV